MLSKISVNIILFLSFFVLTSFSCRATAEAFYQIPQIIADQPQIERNPFLPAPNPLKSIEPEMPELYIGTTLRQGLNEVLPQTFRKGLDFDASYNRAEGLPTMQFDYFLPIKAWNDKNVFVTPRCSLSVTKETFSIGLGVRQLLSHDVMIGFHAFHDWERPRRQAGSFLKQAGAGIEFTALPGKYSNLVFSLNGYLPVNEKLTLREDGAVLTREALTPGIDARLGFVLPPLVNWLDIRLDARAHSFRGIRIDDTGYRAGITVTSRDGMFRASYEREKDSRKGDQYRVEGSINLAFDWKDLLQNELPFSAPYKVPQYRYQKKINESLGERVVRRHDIPTDRTENRVTLAATVSDSTVFLTGGFPDLPNSKVTAQVAQSPWKDWADIVTNSSGFYSGSLDLPAGAYRVRLIHKPSGRASAEKTVIVKGKR